MKTVHCAGSLLLCKHFLWPDELFFFRHTPSHCVFRHENSPKIYMFLETFIELQDGTVFIDVCGYSFKYASPTVKSQGQTSILPLLFVCLFLKAIIKSAHNSDVCYCNIKLKLGKNKVA